jgi:hypothetical protein
MEARGEGWDAHFPAGGDHVEIRNKNCKWWTRSQRIRTEGEVPFEVALL